MKDLVTPGCSVYIALLHHSMRDKNGQVVTTAVTNLDIHDIARSARTYGVKKYFLVTPLVEQQQVVRRIMGHWQEGGGREYNPDRAEAFSRVSIISWFRDAVQEIEALEGNKPEVWMTSAKQSEALKPIAWNNARDFLTQQSRPVLVAFGTGWGMTDELLGEGTALLPPIEPESASGYNHLSVRSAVAIALDRLLGERKVL